VICRCQHVSHITSVCFYYLRQLRLVQRSLDHGCCSRSSSSNDSQPPRLLQQSARWSTYWSNVTSTVLRAAARLVLGLPGYAPVSAAMHDTLHWLSFPQRVTFKLCLLTYKCLHGLAPDYLSRFCTLLTSVPGRPLLHSADANKLLVPRSCTASFGLRSFGSSGPTAWNDTPAHLRNLDLSLSGFRQLLKTALFQTVPV